MVAILSSAGAAVACEEYCWGCDESEALGDDCRHGQSSPVGKERWYESKRYDAGGEVASSLLT